MYIFIKEAISLEGNLLTAEISLQSLFLKLLSLSLGSLYYLCKPFLQREKEFY